MILLKIFLWLAALMCLAGLAPLLAPFAVIEDALFYFGMKPPVSTPIFEYALRTAAGCFVGLGFFYAKLATHPSRYGRLVPVGALVLVLVGVTCIAAGFAAGLPNLWFLCEAAAPVVLGLAIYVTWHATKKRH